MCSTFKILLLLLCGLHSVTGFTQQSLLKFSLDSVAIKVDSTDQHTYSRYTFISIKHINLKMNVDFDKKELQATAEYTLERKKPMQYVILDTWKINIQSVELISKEGKSTIAKWQLGNFDEFLGSPLIILLNNNTAKIRIKYSSINSRALVWVDATSTDSGTHPMLISETEPCNLRSFLPSMDSPNTRFTFTASVTVPKGLLCLMSAVNPRQISTNGKYRFKMEQPIKPYLFSLAIGNFAFASLTDSLGVYAEPTRLNEVKQSTVNLSKMFSLAQEICGKYRWERYDLLFLPSRAYPYFGMENPRLTHISTLAISKDQSMDFVIAHELIHSWAGNQNGNANWGSLFVNEGLCEYLAMRVIELLKDKEYADLLTYNNVQLVKEEKEPLALDLHGKEADNAFGNMRYYGGALFFRNIETIIGRIRMNDFIQSYFSNIGYKDYNTQQFLEVLKTHLRPEEEKDLDINKWIYGGGIPDGVANFSSAKIKAVRTTFDKCMMTKQIQTQDFKNWDSHEFRYFFDLIFECDSLNGSILFNNLVQNAAFEKMQLNADALMAFYLNAIKLVQIKRVESDLRTFLLNTGRIKILKQVYAFLYIKDRKLAISIYCEARKHYHPLTQKVIDKIIPECH